MHGAPVASMAAASRMLESLYQMFGTIQRKYVEILPAHGYYALWLFTCGIVTGGVIEIQAAITKDCHQL